MAYEPRVFQSTTANTPPTGTDPMVDNTANGDVQAIKLINPTAGSTAPWIGQAAQAQSLPTTMSVEDAALLTTLLLEGTPETGQALGAGGAHALGWLSSIRKAITDRLPAALVGGRLDVNIGAAGATVPISGTVGVSGNVEIANDVGNPIPVSGTFWQATQPVSIATAPALVASEAHIGAVGGTSVLVTGTMTRPADTNIYTAGDGVTTATSSPAAMTVASAARVSGGSGILFGGFLEKTNTSTTSAQFRGWVYQDTPSSIPNDNAAFTAAVHADYQKLVGTFTCDFTTGIVGSDGVRAPIVLERTNMAYKCVGTSFVVILQALAAYTPTSAEVFRAGFDCAQD